MASGLLEVRGQVRVEQFWPVGTSDADTTKIVVDVGAGAFQFRPHPGAPFNETHAFDQATVRGKTTKPAIENGQIVVRLQGVDAPELHYRPSAAIPKAEQTKKQREKYLELNEDYRQRLAETATVELTQLLQQAGPSPIPCVVTSAVDEPHEVFDTYGRMVADIIVQIGGHDVNVNTWLLTQGWAFPSFYNSMSGDEIHRLTYATNDAWENGRGVWPHQDDFAKKLDFTLIFRRPSQHPVPNPATDAGPVLLPKLFRRLSTWAVNKKATMVTGSFRTYLKDHVDQVFLTDDYLTQGPAAQTRSLHEFLDNTGFFSLWPEELVFKESPSRLTGPGGATVVW